MASLKGNLSFLSPILHALWYVDVQSNPCQAAGLCNSSSEWQMDAGYKKDKVKRGVSVRDCRERCLGKSGPREQTSGRAYGKEGASRWRKSNPPCKMPSAWAQRNLDWLCVDVGQIVSQFTPDMHVRYEAAFHNDLVPMRMTASYFTRRWRISKVCPLVPVCTGMESVSYLGHELEMHWGKGLTSHAVNLPMVCFPSF